MNYHTIEKSFGEFAKELCYSSPMQQETFTTEPTNQCDFDRLMNRKADCFRKENIAPSKQHLPKTIIVTDPTFSSNQTVQRTLGLLKRMGFTVYLYSIDGLVPFDSTVTRVVPPSSYHREKILSDLKKIDPTLCEDQLLVLNYFGSRRLLSAADHQQYADVTDFFDLDTAAQDAIKQSYRNEPIGIFNKISKEKLIDSVSYFSNLRELNLTHHKLTVDQLKALSQGTVCPALDKLVLSKNDLSHLPTDTFVKLLARFPHLRELDLNNCQLTVDQRAAFCQGAVDPALEKLVLYHNNLSDLPTDTLVKLLARFPNLRELNLCICHLTVSQLVALSQGTVCPTLEKLDLSSNDLSNLPTDTFVKLLARFPNLCELDLSRCRLTVDQLAAFLLQKDVCPTLEKLVLSHNDNLSYLLTYRFVNLLVRFPNLRELNLKNCSLFCDRFTILFLEGVSPALEKLFLSGNNLSQLSIVHFVKLLARFPNLRELDLCGCHLTVDQLADLSQGEVSPALEKLFLSGNDFSQLSTVHFVKLLARFPNLREQGLRNCHLTVDQLAVLSQKELSSSSAKQTPRAKPNTDIDTALNPGEKTHVTQYFKNVDSPDYRLAVSYSELEENGFRIIHPPIGTNQQTEILPTPPPITDEIRAAKNIEPGNSTLTPKELSSSSAKQTPKAKPNTDIDIDTALNPGKKIHATQYFKNVDSPDYRLAVSYSELEENGFRIIHPPIGTNQQTEILPTPPPITDEIRAAENIELGNITLMPNEWTVLPSLNPAETLCGMNLPQGINVELKYDPQHNFYLIKSNSIFPVACEFAIHLPREQYPIGDFIDSIDPAQSNFDEFLKVLASYAQRKGNLALVVLLTHYFITKFSNGPLKGVSSKDSTAKKLEAIIMQRKGSCRHVTKAFLYLMAMLEERYDIIIPSRIVRNDCHSYAEIKLDHGWQAIDLGGYPTQLIEQPAVDPKVVLSDATGHQCDTYADEFAVWECEGLEKSTLNALLKPIAAIDTSPKKLLFLVDSPEEVEQLYWYLRQVTEKNQSPCYGIRESEAMELCDALQITPSDKDNLANYRLVPGELKTFLETANRHADRMHSLLINWETFKTMERAGAQSCLDNPKPKIGTTALSSNVRIMGIMTKATYEKADNSFISRIGKAGIFEINCGKLFQEEEKIEKSASTQPEKEAGPVLTRNLYDQFDQSQLVGRPALKESGWCFEEGILTECVEKKINTLKLINPPDGPEFHALCEEIRCRKTVFYNGKKYQLPKDFQIIHETRRYEFGGLTASEMSPEATDENFILINQSTYQSLYSKIKIEKGQVYSLPGRIVKGGNINALITETLPTGWWAKMLDEAKEKGCHLQLFIYPEISLPAGIKKIGMKTEKEANKPEVIERDAISEIQTKKSQPMSLDEDALIIPVTEETSYSDLIYRIKIDFNQRTIDGETCYLLKALEEAKNSKTKRTIILSGTVSERLQAQLATLFLPTPYLWVNDERKAFPNCKIKLIAHQHNNKQEDHKIKVSVDADTLPEVFEQRRCDALIEAMKKDSVIFIEGETSVGKSYFMQHILEKKRSHIKVYSGFSQLRAWAEGSESEKGQQKLLFIDETNLQSAKQLTPLLGIYGNPKGIILEGKFYPLTEEHKIVFAGNPEGQYQYRHLPYFSQYEMNTVEFPTLPERYLKEVIMEAVWQAADIPLTQSHKINKEEINRCMLDLYQRALAISPNITPRNLQMMVLHFLTCLETTPLNQANTQQFFAIDPFTKHKNIMLYVAYLEIIGHLTQDERKTFVDNMPDSMQTKIKAMKKHEVEQLKENKNKRVKKDRSSRFVITPCYHEALLQLNKLMALRELKAKHKKLSQFGYQGITLEGLPGIGKTELVKNWLETQGYQPYQKNRAKGKRGLTEQSKQYYQLNPKSLSEMKRVIKICVKKGLVLLVDEANLMLPLLESELNAALQGEQQPSKATSGFMLIGTQNPSILYSGRLSASQAFDNRQLTTTIEPKKEDLQIILEEKSDLTTHEIASLINDFERTKKYAETRCLPTPTPRELFAKGWQQHSMTEQYQRVVTGRRTAFVLGK